MIVITDETVGRFLSRKLPEGFRPDCYVEFDHERGTERVVADRYQLVDG
jgi:hypothetical protein